MTKQTRNKLISGALRGTSTLVAAGLPIWLIAQKFPLWATEQTTSTSLTGYGIVATIILSMTFRKKLFMMLKPIWQKLKQLRGVVLGTTLLGGAILGICFLVREVYPILPDIETICAGAVTGGLVGVGLDTTASVLTREKASKTAQEAQEQKEVA